MTDLVKELLSLPEYIDFEGISFRLLLFKNHSYEIRLVYDIDSVELDSPHRNRHDNFNCWDNPFIKENESYSCSFLYLAENISDEESLLHAIEDCSAFLNNNHLIP
jgi:hypothetical protein